MTRDSGSGVPDSSINRFGTIVLRSTVSSELSKRQLTTTAISSYRQVDAKALVLQLSGCVSSSGLGNEVRKIKHRRSAGDARYAMDIYLPSRIRWNMGNGTELLLRVSVGGAP